MIVRSDHQAFGDLIFELNVTTLLSWIKNEREFLTCLYYDHRQYIKWIVY
jgi:hypothetical protein